MTLEPPVIPDTAVCLGCGYSLRGLPRPVCPECGRGFDPSDPATFRDTSKPRSFWHTGIGSPDFWSFFAAPPQESPAGRLARTPDPSGRFPAPQTGTCTSIDFRSARSATGWPKMCSAASGGGSWPRSSPGRGSSGRLISIRGTKPRHVRTSPGRFCDMRSEI